MYVICSEFQNCESFFLIQRYLHAFRINKVVISWCLYALYLHLKMLHQNNKTMVYSVFLTKIWYFDYLTAIEIKKSIAIYFLCAFIKIILSLYSKSQICRQQSTHFQATYTYLLSIIFYHSLKWNNSYAQSISCSLKIQLVFENLFWDVSKWHLSESPPSFCKRLSAKTHPTAISSLWFP